MGETADGRREYTPSESRSLGRVKGKGAELSGQQLAKTLILPIKNRCICLHDFTHSPKRRLGNVDAESCRGAI